MNLTGTAYHPDFGQLVDYQAIPLSADPDTQVAQTIDMMRRYVDADSGSPAIQRDAAQARAVGAGDPLADAFWWVKNKVAFQRDEQTAAPMRNLLDGDVVEVLLRPSVLADMGAPKEDCDGFASYLPALVRAMAPEVPCSFVTVAADGNQPDRYSHVYLACYPNGERIALDASHGPFPGWECPNAYGKRREWPIAAGLDWSALFLFAAVALGAWALARSAGLL